MSQDLIIGSTNLDWSRGTDAASCGIVISDKEIKDAMGRHHRHKHHKRGYGQYPGQYQGQPGGSIQPDPQKLQLLRSTYRQIRDGHSNWLVNQDHQNNNWNTSTSTYLQTSKLWARQQLQQQQLPIRSDPSTQGQWQQPLSWFQARTQTALNNSASQMATSITSTQQPTTYPLSYTPPVSQFSPQPSQMGPTNAYYPAPGDGSYDDDSGKDSFITDEARAEGENQSTNCGDNLSHSEYRALIMKQAIKNAGGKTPSTRHLFAAKKAVDNVLGNSRTGIYIPGAKPCRRTV